jgi:hypothetical protein
MAMVQSAELLDVIVDRGESAKSLNRRSVDPGFDIEHVLTARISLPSRAYGDAESIRSFYQRAIDQLAGHCREQWTLEARPLTC